MDNNHIVKNSRGFSLIEMMVVMSLALIILGGIYFMVLQYGDVSRTEHSRIRLQQESRYMASAFSSELKNAGSVLTLANTGGFLADTPFFNGVYPLNNTTFPDGIILATGDPDAVAVLSQPYSSSSGNVLPVVDTLVYDPDADGDPPQWARGNKGIVIGKDGYYVFSVLAVTTTSITIRGTAVYYSGLLNTANYVDTATPKGNAVSFPKKAPVIRLSSFSIYLFKQVNDRRLGRDVRQFVRVTDANGQADMLADNTTAETSVLSENIWDMQIAYTAYPSFPDTSVKNQYFAGGITSSSLPNLLSDIRAKILKEMDFTLVVLTDEYGGTGEVTLTVPAVGDEAAYSLPTGKYGYKMLSLLIEPRNYNIKI